MITVSDIEEILKRDCYRLYWKALGEISRDESGRNKTYLENFMTRFPKYDDIIDKEVYKKNPPKAPDMIFVYKETIYFVEFKSGRIERIMKKCEKNKKGKNNDKCENTGDCTGDCKTIDTSLRDKCLIRTAEDECTHVKMDIKLKGIEGAFITLRELVLKNRKEVDFSDIIGLKKSYILVYNPERNPENPESGKINVGGKVHRKMGACVIRFGLHIYKETFFHDIATYTFDFFAEWLRKRNLLDQSDISRIVQLKEKENAGI